jgi:hypothetical protein
MNPSNRCEGIRPAKRVLQVEKGGVKGWRQPECDENQKPMLCLSVHSLQSKSTSKNHVDVYQLGWSMRSRYCPYLLVTRGRPLRDWCGISRPEYVVAGTVNKIQNSPERASQHKMGPYGPRGCDCSNGRVHLRKQQGQVPIV